MNLRSLCSRASAATLVLAVTVAPSLGRAAEAGESRPPALSLAVARARLSNGLEVLVQEDHKAPVVAVSVWYHVGGRDDPPGRSGLAHLFEHLMFAGSKHVPAGAHLRELERAGASAVRASTSVDRTSFSETVPTSRLELALWLESDRMGFLLDRLDAAALSAARDLVRDERRQAIDAVPAGKVEELLASELYPPDHPYHRLAMGAPDELAAVTLDEAKAFFRTWYGPENATIVLAGDIDAGAAVALVEEYFGAIAGLPASSVGKIPDRSRWRHPAAVTLGAERVLEIPASVPTPRVYLAWPTPPVFRGGDAELDLAASALAGGRTSRLRRRLVDDMQLAESVTAYEDSHALGSRFVIVAVARPGKPAAALRDAIDDELRRLGEDGPTDDELARGKASALAGVIFSLERDEGRANLLSSYRQLAHDPAFAPRDLERYAHATRVAVADAVKQYLPLDRRVVAVVRPDPGAPLAGVVERADVTLPPSSPAGAPR